MEKRPNWHENVFFGLHYDLHPAEDDTELGRETTYEHIRAELEKVKPDFVQYDCKGHEGFSGYATEIGTPSPGIVNDALAIWRQVTRDMGIPLSIHYSGVWNTVAVSQHPEWAQVGANGERHKDHTCNTSDYTGSLMIPHLLEVIDRYDIDGMWIDGDNWATAPCWCDRCCSLFREETGQGVPKGEGESGWDEWLAFHRRNFEEHMHKVADAVHERKPSCLVCSNWMYSVRQPDPVTVEVDYLSGDFSRSFGAERAAAEARFLDSRGMAWDLMAWGFFTRTGHEGWTFKSVPHLCQEAAIVLANGGNLSIYDQPERSGRLIGWHQDRMAKVAAWCRERQNISQNTVAIPQVAVLHSSSHYYRNNIPSFNLGSGAYPVEGALHALLENGYPVDILDESAFLKRSGEYPMIVVPEQTHLPLQIVEAVRAYVEDGGRLLISGAHLAGDWDSFLGVKKGSIAPTGLEGYNYLPAEEGAVTVRGGWQAVTLEDAGEVAPLLQSRDPLLDKSGYPAATEVSRGKGKAVAIFGPIFTHFYETHYPGLREFLGKMVQALSPELIVSLEAAPRVEISLRRQGDRLLVHLVNRGTDHPLSPRNHAVENVPPVGPIGLQVRLDEKPKKVYLSPDAGGLDWKWENGSLVGTLEHLDIHNVIVIES